MNPAVPFYINNRALVGDSMKSWAVDRPDVPVVLGAKGRDDSYRAIDLHSVTCPGKVEMCDKQVKTPVYKAAPSDDSTLWEIRHC